MSDRFILQANCSVCGTDLNQNEDGQILMMAVGDSIDLTCPKCRIVWRFWIEVTTRQKKIGQKKIKTKEKTHL